MAETESMATNRKSAQTLVVHDKHDARHYGSVTTPLYQTSLFSFASHEDFDRAMEHFSDQPVYSRGNNPTVQQLERRLAQLQGGEKARCFASGMAAISAAVLSAVGQGDHIVCVHQVYGPARKLMEGYLSKMGIETTFVDGSSNRELAAAVRGNTKLIYLESPTSLMMQIQDLTFCAELAKSIGATTIIDNTWATPCLQNPFAFGIDLVVHSTSKYIGGHSDGIGGVIIGSSERMRGIDENEFLLLGGIMTPHTASLMMRGLRTLPLRMERFHQSGLQVAEHLERMPLVKKVHHPGLLSHPQHELAKAQMSGYGSLFAIELDLPVGKAKRWADYLDYFRIGVSWGGYESLVTVPNLPDGYDAVTGVLVRMYVGLEDPQQLIADIERAFERLTKEPEGEV